MFLEVIVRSSIIKRDLGRRDLGNRDHRKDLISRCPTTPTRKVIHLDQIVTQAAVRASRCLEMVGAPCRMCKRQTFQSLIWRNSTPRRFSFARGTPCPLGVPVALCSNQIGLITAAKSTDALERWIIFVLGRLTSRLKEESVFSSPFFGFYLGVKSVTC